MSALPDSLTTDSGVTYQPAERSRLANMLGHLVNNSQDMDLVPEGAQGVDRIRISLS